MELFLSLVGAKLFKEIFVCAFAFFCTSSTPLGSAVKFECRLVRMRVRSNVDLCMLPYRMFVRTVVLQNDTGILYSGGGAGE